jgi:hypothetical protein
MEGTSTMRYVPALRSCGRGTRALNSIRESATIAHWAHEASPEHLYS